jgi:hypothetical protein
MIKQNFNKDYNIDSLHILQAQYRSRSKVELLQHNDNDSDWIFREKKITNQKSDFFNIGLYKTSSSICQFLMKQKLPALVVLLIAEIQGEDFAILNCRFEPGLIGKINFTSTIQSTPNNYSQSHGGKPTPFIEVLDQPEKYGAVIYDSFQFDWGDFYISKTKRYLIIKLNTIPELPSGFVWFHIKKFKQLALENLLISNDLRVCIALFKSLSKQMQQLKTESSPPYQNQSLESIPFSTDSADYFNNRIGFFKVSTRTREVKSWVQPLIIPSKSKTISLTFKQSGNQKLYGVQKKSQPGLLGKNLWFPANIIHNSKPCRQVSTCAEGGRFWQYLINVQLFKLAHYNTDESSCIWLSKEDLSLIVLKTCTSSLELRLAWSIT